jgi:3-oxoacyl-[acyl-carrier-protein] synthase-3
MKFKICAIEKYLPQQRIASATLDQLADGVTGRIEKNTGVQYRHHVSAQETVCSMGALALQAALAKANLRPADLDLLVFAGASFDYPVPHNAVIIKSMITDDTVHFNCFDIDATCLSYLQALDIAQLYLQSARYKCIAIVCSEIASKALTPKDEKVFGLFGDAAVATIIEATEQAGYTTQCVHFKNYPSGAYYAMLPIGGAINRGKESTADDSGYYFDMNGKSLIRLTLQHLHEFVAELEAKAKCKIADFDQVITHQTSRFGNEYFAKYYKIPSDKTTETLSQYGNCISASIPLGLEAFIHKKTHHSKHKILLLGTGAGLTIGGMVLQYG